MGTSAMLLQARGKGKKLSLERPALRLRYQPE